jgi:hypothetical protein
MQKSQRENHIAYWRQSGQSKKEYSRLAGIKYATFISWFKDKEKTGGGTFIKLENSGTTASRPGFEIVFPNGIRMYTEESITVDLLKSLSCV